MDYALLIGRIKNKFKTQARFAEALKLSKSGLSAKLNNHQEFTTDEIRRACELLDIPAQEIPTYFFSPKVA